MDALRHTGPPISYQSIPRLPGITIRKQQNPRKRLSLKPEYPPLCPPARQAQNSVPQHGTIPHPQHNLTSPPHRNFRMSLCTLVYPGCYHGQQLQVPPASPPAPPHLQRPTAKGTPRLCTEDLLTLQPSVAGNHTTHVVPRSPSLLRLCLCADCPFTCHSLPHLS